MSTSLALACQLNSGSPIKSLPRRVRSILNKYGASLLMPGVNGVMRFGYQPGNYRESTGQTLAAADQQVGLVVDAARSPGPEICPPTTSLTGWSAGVSSDVVQADDYIQVTNSASAEAVARVNAASTIAGAFYEVVVEVLQASNNGVVIVGGRRQGLGGVGLKRYIVQAQNTEPTNAIRFGTNIGTPGGSLRFRLASARELPGIHASQPTSGFQPVLRNASGIQSWQFDGTDDRLSLSAVPFQMADDHFVVAGATRGETGATRRLFHVGSGDIPRVACLSFSSTGIPDVSYRNDSGNFVPVTGDTAWPQSPVVLSVTSIATALRLRADSALLATGTRPTGATTLTAATVGAHTAGTAYFNGHIHGVIFGKGAISDSELMTLERFMASLQGRTL